MFTRLAQVAVVASALVLGLGLTASAGEKVKGVITAVEPDNHHFIVTVGDQQQEFFLMLTAPVQLDGKDADAWKLKPGQKVEVTFEEREGKKKATDVQATSD